MTTSTFQQDCIDLGIPAARRFNALLNRRQRELACKSSIGNWEDRARCYDTWFQRILDDRYDDWRPDLEAYILLDLLRRHPFKGSPKDYSATKERHWHQDAAYERYLAAGESTRQAAASANKSLSDEFKSTKWTTIKTEATERRKLRAAKYEEERARAFKEACENMLSHAARFRSEAIGQPAETAACYRRAADLWENDATNLQPPRFIDAPVGSPRWRDGWKYLADERDFPPSTWALFRSISEIREYGDLINREMAAAKKHCRSS